MKYTKLVHCKSSDKPDKVKAFLKEKYEDPKARVYARELLADQKGKQELLADQEEKQELETFLNEKYEDPKQCLF